MLRVRDLYITALWYMVGNSTVSNKQNQQTTVETCSTGFTYRQAEA